MDDILSREVTAAHLLETNSVPRGTRAAKRRQQHEPLATAHNPSNQEQSREAAVAHSPGGNPGTKWFQKI